MPQSEGGPVPTQAKAPEKASSVSQDKPALSALSTGTRGTWEEGVGAGAARKVLSALGGQPKAAEPEHLPISAD